MMIYLVINTEWNSLDGRYYDTVLYTTVDFNGAVAMKKKLGVNEIVELKLCEECEYTFS